MPATCVSSAADAVLTSTPTRLTVVSTTPSSCSAKRFWLTSCWYSPIPIAFGSILTSSASGSSTRRAIDDRAAQGHVQVGQFGARQRAGAVDARARFVDHQVMQVRIGGGQFGDQLLALARRRPVADGDQGDAVALDQAAQGLQRLIPAALRLVRIDRLGRQYLAGLVDHGELAAGAKCRDPAPARSALSAAAG